MVIPRFGAGHLRVTHPSATLPPRRIQGFPFDLHVLGTPPAFILSQDQTLRKFTFRVLKPKLCLGPKAFANLPITLQLLRSSQTAAEYITPQTCCQIRERLCPAVLTALPLLDSSGAACLPRGKKEFYHNPGSLSNRRRPKTWRQTNQQIQPF
jgi:hypothetical protein